MLVNTALNLKAHLRPTFGTQNLHINTQYCGCLISDVCHVLQLQSIPALSPGHSVAGSSRDEVEATEGLPVRKSLVPRKTFLGSLRTMRSTLPKVAEGNSGFGERLFGAKSHIPGLEVSASLGRPGLARPSAANGEQLLEVRPQIMAAPASGLPLSFLAVISGIQLPGQTADTVSK